LIRTFRRGGGRRQRCSLLLRFCVAVQGDYAVLSYEGITIAHVSPKRYVVPWVIPLYSAHWALYISCGKQGVERIRWGSV
jgi:hypothetical protein